MPEKKNLRSQRAPKPGKGVLAPVVDRAVLVLHAVPLGSLGEPVVAPAVVGRGRGEQGEEEEQREEERSHLDKKKKKKNWVVTVREGNVCFYTLSDLSLLRHEQIRIAQSRKKMHLGQFFFKSLRRHSRTTHTCRGCSKPSQKALRDCIVLTTRK